jgi:hypothetical protein
MSCSVRKREDMAAFDFDQTAESVSARPARRGLEYCRVERALHSCFKQKQFGWNTRTGFREEICDENLPECDLSHNCIDKINEKIVGSEEYLNSELGNRLLERKKEGLCLRVQHATPFRPRQFPTGALQVPRQCRPMVPGSVLFDRHSVVDPRNGQLLDITQLGDRAESFFLPHNGTQSKFDELPNQVVTIDISQAFA